MVAPPMSTTAAINTISVAFGLIAADFDLITVPLLYVPCVRLLESVKESNCGKKLFYQVLEVGEHL